MCIRDRYITDELTNAFKCNQLQSVLKKYHYPVIEKTVETYFDASLPNGKILVLGSSSCSVRHLEATFKALGLSDRLDVYKRQEVGSTEEVMACPKDEYTRILLDSVMKVV